MDVTASTTASPLSDGNSPPILSAWASKIRAIESYVRRSEDEDDQGFRAVIDNATLKRNGKKDKRKQRLGKDLSPQSE